MLILEELDDVIAPVTVVRKKKGERITIPYKSVHIIHFDGAEYRIRRSNNERRKFLQVFIERQTAKDALFSLKGKQFGKNIIWSHTLDDFDFPSLKDYLALYSPDEGYKGDYAESAEAVFDTEDAASMSCWAS